MSWVEPNSSTRKRSGFLSRLPYQPVPLHVEEQQLYSTLLHVHDKTSHLWPVVKVSRYGPVLRTTKSCGTKKMGERVPAVKPPFRTSPGHYRSENCPFVHTTSRIMNVSSVHGKKMQYQRFPLGGRMRSQSQKY